MIVIKVTIFLFMNFSPFINTFSLCLYYSYPIILVLMLKFNLFNRLAQREGFVFSNFGFHLVSDRLFSNLFCTSLKLLFKKRYICGSWMDGQTDSVTYNDANAN